MGSFLSSSADLSFGSSHKCYICYWHLYILKVLQYIFHFSSGFCWSRLIALSCFVEGTHISGQYQKVESVNDTLYLCSYFVVTITLLAFFNTYHLIFKKSNTMESTIGVGTFSRTEYINSSPVFGSYWSISFSV